MFVKQVVINKICIAGWAPSDVWFKLSAAYKAFNEYGIVLINLYAGTIVDAKQIIE